ncbi:MAG: prephenate dehydrogenase/arogenate dehydrogenase family protein, partial [Lentisphaeria bacterium]|nr:prephenate dehydrogenase/arogenate dehydrogenase family protein [Lentisphaeria bacterium]
MQVAIIGLGLLGASLGMALRGKGVRRLGWTRRENIRRWAMDCDVIDETAETLPEILAGADIVIFAMPVPAIIRTIEEFAADFRPGSIVTDLGSVKSGVMAAGRTHLLPRGVHFIGGHPMAGTEKSGPESAFPTLYDNADVFLCPFPETPPEKLDALKSLWESL